MENKHLFNRFLLKVDISGIQNFIFDIPSDNASKNLKGRSFYVYSLTHFAETFFKQHFSLPAPEIIFNGGGNLLMYLSANENELKTKIDEFQRDFLNSDIYPFIAYVKADDDNFEIQNSQLGTLLSIQKFKRNLNFTQYELSFNNIDWGELSKQLRKSKGFSIITDNKNTIFSIDKLSLTFSKEEKFAVSFENNLLNKIPINETGNVIGFDNIAKNALERGADEKLAALKMDVDNLGSLFIGMEKEKYKQMSQAVEIFFSTTIYTNVLQPYIDSGDIYPVFAGGDDTFIIGAWDKVFEVIPKIHSEFDKAQKEWRKNIIKKDDDITISAGVIIVPPKYPMIRLAEETENMLSLAKKEGKNRISIFGECITWEEFEKTSEMVIFLKDLILKKGESKALLHRIKSSSIGFRSLQDRIRKRNEIDFPKVYRLKYFLRNVKPENKKELDKLFTKYSDALIKDFLANKTNADKSVLTNPAIFPIASRWTELLIKNINQAVYNSENKKL